VDVAQHLAQAAKAAWAEEIERAIANAKRTAEDKMSRREWWRVPKGKWLGWESEMGSIAFGGGRLLHSRSDFPMPEGH